MGMTAREIVSLSAVVAVVLAMFACTGQLDSRRRAVQQQPRASEPVGDSKPATVKVPMGSAYGPCYPNSTCDGDLVCDVQIDTCAPPPELGSDGGPCYGNQTCDGYLVCRQGRCVVPPAGAVEVTDDELLQPDDAE